LQSHGSAYSVRDADGRRNRLGDRPTHGRLVGNDQSRSGFRPGDTDRKPDRRLSWIRRRGVTVPRLSMIK
jgi:hypothetical protein